MKNETYYVIHSGSGFVGGAPNHPDVLTLYTELSDPNVLTFKTPEGAAAESVARWPHLGAQAVRFVQKVTAGKAVEMQVTFDRMGGYHFPPA